MSFWNIEKPTDGNFETGGGDIAPIPKNTSVLAAPDEAKWEEYDGDRFISIRWAIMAPAEYKNRKVFQKIRVEDSDPKKQEKAKRMLAAIDANAGGKLMAAGEEPTDKSLTVALCNKPMVLKLQVWEMEINGEERSGNWVSAVSPRKGSEPVEPVKKEEPAPAPADYDFEDDIPFN